MLHVWFKFKMLKRKRHVMKYFGPLTSLSILLTVIPEPTCTYVRAQTSNTQCSRYPRSTGAGRDPIAVPRRWSFPSGAWSGGLQDSKGQRATPGTLSRLRIGHLRTCPAQRYLTAPGATDLEPGILEDACQ
jgi:hypothetical protein